MNYETSKSGNKFVRSQSRGATDWDTLKRVRDAWKGKLIVKGVMSPKDAVKVKEAWCRCYPSFKPWRQTIR